MRKVDFFTKVHNFIMNKVAQVTMTMKALFGAWAVRGLAFAMTLILGWADAMAQDTTSGAAAITGVTNDIKKYVEPVQNLLYAIAGVVALGGAISIFIKMNNEEQDIKKSIMLLVGACIFLIAAAEALPIFFGI